MSGVLLRAVSAGRPRQVRLLLDSGISIETSDECGQTPLIRSIFIEHPRHRERVVKLLLKYGARVSDADLAGRSALSWACLYALEKEVRILLEEADVDLNLNQQDMNGQTCLFHAAISGSAAVVKLVVDALKRYDMSTEVPNNQGVTPLMQAIKLGHDVCATILIYQGQATVGLSMKGPNDLTYAEMWSNLRRANVRAQDDADTPRFLPALTSSCLRTIRIREDVAARRTGIPTYLDSDEEEVDQDSTYGSEVSCSTDGSMREACRARVRHKRPDTPLSTRTVSLTSSTEACVDSDSGEEVDAYSSPITPRNKCLFVPARQLHTMFNIYEEQNTPSFRPAAAKPKRDGDLTPEAPVSPRILASPIPQPITGDLRKVIARKQLPKARLVQISNQSKCNTSWRAFSSSSESEGEKIFTQRVKAPLPRISSRICTKLPGCTCHGVNYQHV